jgi:type IV secretory pathway VirB2 component (pilin)
LRSPRPLASLGKSLKRLRLLGFVLTAQALTASSAWAGTGGEDLPWNTPLGTLLDALTGSTGRLLAGLMVVVAGLVWGFVRHEEGARRFAAGVIGIALVFGALQVVDGLAFAGGLF